VTVFYAAYKADLWKGAYLVLRSLIRHAYLVLRSLIRHVYLVLRSLIRHAYLVLRSLIRHAYLVLRSLIRHACLRCLFSVEAGTWLTIPSYVSRGFIECFEVKVGGIVKCHSTTLIPFLTTSHYEPYLHSICIT
jgi:hypothetical protein